MATRNMPRPQLVEKPEPEIGWQEYPRIPEAEYLGYCRTARAYIDPAFKRHVCMLVWDVLGPHQQVLARIPMFINLGKADKGQKAHAGPRSLYLRAWVEANGGPPVRGDRLSPRVFTRRMAKIRVRDTASKAVPYSVVAEILSWETGAFGVKQSSSQSVKDGNTQSPRAQRLKSSACQNNKGFGVGVAVGVGASGAKPCEAQRSEPPIHVEASAPAGVKDTQAKSVQGAGGPQLPSVNGNNSSTSPLMDPAARAERIAYLKAQEEQARKIAAAIEGGY